MSGHGSELHRGHPRPTWSLIVLVLSLVMAGGSCLVNADDEPASQTFSDEVLVKEVGIIVNSRDVMPKRLEASMEANEFSVFEDGGRRTVVRLIRVDELPRHPRGESADSEEAGPWSIVIYVDRELSLPSSAAASLLGIAERTSELRELGTVTVAVADPEPTIFLSRSQAPHHVAKILLDLAESAQKERDSDPLRMDSPTSKAAQPSAEVIRRQWDRLVTFLSDTSYDGPRALLLVNDGFILSPGDLQMLSGRGGFVTHDDVTPDLATVVMDTAQALSSYGWLTVPVSLGQPRPKQREPAADEFDEWRDLSEGRVLSGDQRTRVNFFGTTKVGKRAAALDDRLFEAYSLPRLAPLRALAEATAGALAWHDEQLEAALRGLSEHLQLWYQAPDPHDGRIRRIEVMHDGTSKHFKTPWWRRSSTPQIVAEARLRLLLEGETLGSGQLLLSAEALSEAVEGGNAVPTWMLRLQIEPVEFADNIDVGHFRLSVGQAVGTEVVTIQHLLDFDAPPLGGQWEYLLPVELEASADRLAVVVEDLSREVWGAATLEFPGRERRSQPSNDMGR